MPHKKHIKCFLQLYGDEVPFKKRFTIISQAMNKLFGQTARVHSLMLIRQAFILTEHWSIGTTSCRN